MKVPLILVVMNSPGWSIERSTWLSAAKWISARLVLRQQRRYQRAVANVAMDEYVARIVRDRGQIGQIV
ncbi:hypothetical protein LP420_26185 [Massilia sp. B-10]|nr:hypothetical protein LP420_26185 [Massilia sp. B-10]